MDGLVAQITDFTASSLTAVLFSLREKSSLEGLRAVGVGGYLQGSTQQLMAGTKLQVMTLS